MCIFVICAFVFRALFGYDEQTNDLKVIETGGQLSTHVNLAGNRKTVYACVWIIAERSEASNPGRTTERGVVL